MESTRMWRAGASAGIFLLVLAMAGCATSEDPHQGGFINGIAGVTSGSYQRRVDERQQQVDELEQTRHDMEQRLSDTEQERARVATKEATLRASLAALEQRNRHARAELLTAQQQELASKEKLENLLAEQQGIETEVIALIRSERPSPIPVSAGAPPPSTEADRRLALQQQKDRADEIADRQRKLDAAISEVFGRAPDAH